MALATECPVCLGVSAGGRIRLTDEGAELLQLLLHDKRAEQLGFRRTAVDAGEDHSGYDSRLKLIKQLHEEVSRTQVEMGWLDGQPQRTNP